MATMNIKNLPPEARAALPKAGKIGALGLIGNGIGFAFDAGVRIASGEGVLSSVVKAGAGAVVQDTMMAFMGGPATALMIGGSLAVAGGQMLIENGKNNLNSMTQAFGGPNGARHNKVINSDAAATMRQRGMAMINQNGEATRSVLGSEARAYFRNMSNY